MIPLQIKCGAFGLVLILASINPTDILGQTQVSSDATVTTIKAELEMEHSRSITPDTPAKPNVNRNEDGPTTLSDAKSATAAVLPAKPHKNDSDPKPQGLVEGWQFQFTPYLWIVGISGNAGIGDIVVEVNSGLTDSDVHVNFGFMGTFEARKDKFIILTDLQYSNLGTDRPRPSALIFTSATADFKTFILDPEIGYRVAQNSEKGHSLDLLAGIRYYHLQSDLTLDSTLVPSRFATASKDWVDAVAGLRGKAHLSPNLFLVGKADLGGGGSEFTYQLFGGVGYQISKRLVIMGGYRNLSVDYDKNNLLFDMSLHGPIVGLGIKF